MPMPIDRRAFLRRAIAAGIALPSAATVLAACDPGGSGPRERVTDDPLLDAPRGPDFTAGMPVERTAVLRVYQWKEYLAEDVLRSFEGSFPEGEVRVRVESFTHVGELVARLRDRSTRDDIVFPTVDVLGGLVAEGLLRPLSHGRLPHLDDLWGWFTSDDGPFYDPGQAYSVPYTVYSSGVGWRADLVAAADTPERSGDPFGLFWNPRYRGRVGMYDDHVEALALALQRDGVADLRDATEAQLRAAADDLAAAVAATGLVFTSDGAWDGLPEGEFAAHQAWSGDILTAPRYAREEGHAEAIEHLRYWAPPGPGKVVGVDLMAIGARGRHPELAHAFIDHLLRTPVAIRNFRWNGYQPPLAGVDVDAVSAAGPEAAPDAVPANLLPTLLSEEDFASGQMLVGFGPSEQARWLAQWNRVSAGG
jgi:spermidine/putrescine transport system substrate-binding protein